VTEPAHHKNRGLRLLLLLGALTAVGPLSLDLYLPAFPTLARDFGVTASRVQLSLTACLIGLAAGQLIAGPLSDRWGRRRPVIVGALAYSAVTLLCAVAPSAETLTAARLVQGLAGGVGVVVSRAIVRDLYSGERAAHTLALMGMVLGFAPVVAPILGSHMHAWFGWQSNFVLVALYAGVLWYCVHALLPETLAKRDASALVPRIALANFARLLRSRAFVGYMLVASFGFSGLFAFLAGSAFVFVAVMGESEQGFGVLFGTVMLGNITGSTLGSRLVRRVGIRAIVRAGTALMLAAGIALGALALADVRHPLAIVVPMFAFMVAFMLTMPPATAGALTPFPDIAGSAASLLSFCQFLVASSAALVVGVAFDGTTRPMALTIGVASVAAFVAFRLADRGLSR
jgi:DHA1 family bicyclomycin/chloramphenicol resistance-like MFS transporter